MLFYSIADDYISHLKKTDARVMDNKERPYLGVPLEIGGVKWYVPLTSHKGDATLKAGFVWLFMIHETGAPEEISGHLSIRNMIPAPDCAVKAFNLDIKGQKYKDLLNKQHIFLKAEAERIEKKVATFYDLIIKKKVGDMANRSCDFEKLAEAYKHYKCPDIK